MHGEPEADGRGVRPGERTSRAQVDAELEVDVTGTCRDEMRVEALIVAVAAAQ